METAMVRPSVPARLMRAAERISQMRYFTISLTLVSLVSCIVTGAVMSAPAADTNAGYWLLNFDLVLLLLLSAVIARHVARVWMERRRGIAGSKLHVRLVSHFILLAAAPAIMMAVFSSVFLYYGVHAWFNERVSTAIIESQEVARAYLKEHTQVMRADVLAMANDLNRGAAELTNNPQLMSKVVETQSMLRNLSEVVIFRADRSIIARSRLSFSLELDLPSDRTLEQAEAGDVVLIPSPDGGDRIRALVKLDRYIDAYLYVGRLIDASVLAHMQTTQTAVDEYQVLEGRQKQMQILAMGMFIAVALLLLLAAVWFGLAFSEQLVAPVSALITATERIRAGDLSARVANSDQDDEIGMLGRAFNRMTSQLEAQQSELLTANRMMDERRKFTEAILSGASSGVVGLSREGIITLANQMAQELLQGDSAAPLTGRKLVEFIPDAEEILAKALQDQDRAWPLQTEYAIGAGPRKTILVRVTAAEGGEWAVATVDDISNLVSAQRKAAWADVARRIAHEIKNPLTPIQLSAERLKRKYLPQIKDDPETFEKCTETIIRQVGDIGHMVNEFSAYARMPVPVKRIENIVEVCQDALILQRQAHPDIGFGFIAAGPVVEANCDRSQLTQVMTNLLQNAIDSIYERQESQPGDGRIKIVVEQKGSNISLTVEDNGTGLPARVKDQILEPYVTTKKKGSGLGLAIVKKIMEDHEGSVVLEDSLNQDAKSGAKAILVFPRDV
ncbi:MAG TPA: PAS domain-containing sensor histidine kinase [Patescibacteria group bacterium]|nr:PAS domain-containing sensor histidine kinase [Patescibacteria group bacterium]